MRLASITTKNFAGLPDRAFTFRDSAGKAVNTVVVTGPSGSGKTRLLEAIIAAKETVAPYGRPHRLERQARDASAAVVLETIWQLDDDERVAFRVSKEEVVVASAGPGVDPTLLRGPVRDLLAHYEQGSRRAKVDYFPAARALSKRPVGSAPRPRSELLERLGRLGDARDKYDGLWGWLHAELGRSSRRRDELAAAKGVVFADDVAESVGWLRDALALFVDDPRIRRIDPDTGDLELAGHGGATHGSDGLPTSARQALLFVLELAMVSHSRSVLLVDSPELGQPPASHVRVVSSLAKLTGQSQLILATTSRELIDAQSGVVIELS